jgi:hypothetical protein
LTGPPLIPYNKTVTIIALNNNLCYYRKSMKQSLDFAPQLVMPPVTLSEMPPLVVHEGFNAQDAAFLGSLPTEIAPAPLANAPVQDPFGLHTPRVATSPSDNAGRFDSINDILTHSPVAAPITKKSLDASRATLKEDGVDASMLRSWRISAQAEYQQQVAHNTTFRLGQIIAGEAIRAQVEKKEDKDA